VSSASGKRPAGIKRHAGNELRAAGGIPARIGTRGALAG
jgi:hypothetical protein